MEEEEVQHATMVANMSRTRGTTWILTIRRVKMELEVGKNKTTDCWYCGRKGHKVIQTRSNQVELSTSMGRNHTMKKRLEQATKPIKWV